MQLMIVSILVTYVNMQYIQNIMRDEDVYSIKFKSIE